MTLSNLRVKRNGPPDRLSAGKHKIAVREPAAADEGAGVAPTSA